MRNPQFKKIIPNYKKNILEVTLQEGRKHNRYEMPFSIFRDKKIGLKNKFVSLDIDEALDGQAVTFILQDGAKGDFPADLVLYYCDPTYQWSPLNQIKQAIKDKLKQSKVSIRVLANLLKTSPSQVLRLLNSTELSKQFLQLSHIAEVVGCQIQWQLKKKAA